MLQESGDELHARQGDMTDLMGLVLGIVESNDVAVDEFQAVVGDWRPQHHQAVADRGRG